MPGIDGLLNTVRSLLGIAGLDTSILTGLLSTANAALGVAAPGVDTTALQGLIGALAGDAPACPAAAARRRSPATTTKPATTAPKAHDARPRPCSRPTARSIGSIKVAKNRRSATLTVTPARRSRPKGCLVALDGVVAGKKAFAQKVFVVMRNVTQKVTVKLTSVGGQPPEEEGRLAEALGEDRSTAASRRSASP